jgi:hypothetical protein
VSLNGDFFVFSMRNRTEESAMPRLVVDSNYLRDDKLRDWLGASRKNIAVLTDQAEIEMAKASTAEDFLKLTEVLADFPRQVVLAKEITVASRLRGKKNRMKKRLTDGKRTRTFRQWCKQRDAIKRGAKPFAHHEAHEDAKKHIEDVMKGGASFKDDLVQHAAQHYTADELAIIRSGKPWTDAVVSKVVGGIMDFALKFFALHPAWQNLPEARQMPYTFIFRYALCTYLHALHWIHVGGGKGRKDEKFANDFVDVAFAAYATCFDGFLSDDKLAVSIYNNARYLLDNGFLREDLMPKVEK